MTIYLGKNCSFDSMCVFCVSFFFVCVLFSLSGFEGWDVGFDCINY